MFFLIRLSLDKWVLPKKISRQETIMKQQDRRQSISLQRGQNASRLVFPKATGLFRHKSLAWVFASNFRATSSILASPQEGSCGPYSSVQGSDAPGITDCGQQGGRHTSTTEVPSAFRDLDSGKTKSLTLPQRRISGWASMKQSLSL